MTTFRGYKVSRGDLEDEQERLEQQLNDLRWEIRQVENQLSDLRDELKELDQAEAQDDEEDDEGE